MRLAICGTHCTGKSSLIEGFLDTHPDYIHEPEAYEALEELLGESFFAEANAEDLFRQLEYQVKRIDLYTRNDSVVFERCPLDYVAYLKALADLKRETADTNLLEQAIEVAIGSVDRLDVIAFLPLQKSNVGTPDEEEDLELRDLVDQLLESFLIDDELQILNNNRPFILELPGNTSQRLHTLNAWLSKKS